MKDHIVTLVEAVRLARLELGCYRDPQCRASADWTVERLSELLENRSVDHAMAALAPEEDTPSIVPEDATESERLPSH